MFFYQPLPSAAPLISAQRTISVSDGLTVTCSDSGTLTPPTIQSVETIAIGMSDSTTLTSIGSVTDACMCGVSESASYRVLLTATDSLIVRLNGSGAGSASVEGHDTTSLGLTDTAVPFAMLAVADVTAVGMSDSSSSSALYSTTDNLSVRLNGVGVGEGGPTLIDGEETTAVGLTESLALVSTLSVADSLTVGTTEAVSLISSLSTEDALTIGSAEVSSSASSLSAVETLGVTAQGTISQVAAVLGVTETLALQISEALAPASVTVRVSDTVAIGLNDLFTGSRAFSVTDVGAVGIAESLLNNVTISCADTVQVQSDDLITQITTVIVASETLGVVYEEVLQPIQVSAVSSDAAQSVCGEATTGWRGLFIDDQASPHLSSALSLSAQVFADEALRILAGDSGELSSIVVSVEESCALSLSDTGSSTQNTLVSVTDSLTTGLSESASIIYALTVSDNLAGQLTEACTAFQALVVSDLCSAAFTEDQRSSLPSSASDSTATVLLEAASVWLTVDTADTSILQCVDRGSRQDLEEAVPKYVVDGWQVLLDEGALHELAGPYWAGTTGEDHGLVYADSYGMGRRENPGRMRW